LVRRPPICFVLWLSAAACAGCFESNPQPSPLNGAEPDVTARADAPSSLDSFAPPEADVGTTDSAGGRQDAADAGSGPTDAGGDTVPAGFVPADPGPACQTHADCPSGRCVPGYFGWVCSPACTSDNDCPPGWLCGSVPQAQGKALQYCTPAYHTLCAPCSTNQDCYALASPAKTGVDDPEDYASPTAKFLEQHCTTTGPDDPIRFCTSHVSGKQTCPVGFVLQEDWLDRIGHFDVCVPESGPVCPNCPWMAVEASAAGTGCAHGVQGNLCPGLWHCEPEPGPDRAYGLSACQAPTPEPERWDEADNDCNGVVDDVCPDLPLPDITGCYCGDLLPCWDVCAGGRCGTVDGCDCGACPAGEWCSGSDCVPQFECAASGKGPGCACADGAKACPPALCRDLGSGPICTAYCGQTCDKPPLWWLPMKPCVEQCPPGLECRQWDLVDSGLTAGLCLPRLYCESDADCAGQLNPLAECQQVLCEGSTCTRKDTACPPCQPECAGKSCGPDGCGGLCGGCSSGEVCQSGQCTPCLADCSGMECGAACGPDCGACPPGFVCDEGGLCVCDCTPDCAGHACGPDGCGGVCGTCPAGSVCGPDRACCTPTCTSTACGSTCSAPGCGPDCVDLECGTDGCGASCGACPAGKQCEAGLCVACKPSCDGKACGPDGCGSECGQCPDGMRCTPEGQCSPCFPCCQAKTCGPDGCGGSCGLCPDPAVCVGGSCSKECYAVGCQAQECGPTSDYCFDCGQCPKHWKCSPLLDESTWQVVQRCVPDPQGLCRRAEDCYAYVPQQEWPAGFKPLCLPGSCTCATTN